MTLKQLTDPHTELVFRESGKGLRAARRQGRGEDSSKNEWVNKCFLSFFSSTFCFCPTFSLYQVSPQKHEGPQPSFPSSCSSGHLKLCHEAVLITLQRQASMRTHCTWNTFYWCANTACFLLKEIANSREIISDNLGKDGKTAIFLSNFSWRR